MTYAYDRALTLFQETRLEPHLTQHGFRVDVRAFYVRKYLLS